MKALLALVMMTVSLQAAASPASIKSLTAQLSKALGIKPAHYQFKSGRDARSLIVQKYLKDRKQTKVDSDFAYEEMATSIEATDGSSVGTATLEAAEGLVTSMVDFSNPDESVNKAEVEKRKAAAMKAMERLDKAGAVFGFDNNGSGVCGVNYTTLFVIDVEESTLEEYSFVAGPC